MAGSDYTTDDAGWQPGVIDTTVPHSARVWNYLLGGKDNYTVDREAGELVLRLFPDFAQVARLQREFLIRSVTYLAEKQGIRQFLDIGTGLPTANNTHQVAQAIDPACHIVYVDNDPLVLAHARALLVGTPEGATDYIEADVRDVDLIVERAAKTLDFSEPIALMMLGIMGQIPDSDQPKVVVDQYLAALPTGSYMALSDGTDVNPALISAVTQYNQGAAGSYHLRSPDELATFFEGLELVEPGVVSTSMWQPAPSRWSSHGDLVNAISGVGRKV